MVILSAVACCNGVKLSSVVGASSSRLVSGERSSFNVVRLGLRFCVRILDFKTSSVSAALSLKKSWLLRAQNRGSVKGRRSKTAVSFSTRKSKVRTSGFRVRMRTPAGRRALFRRRAKRTKVFLRKTNPVSGKRS